MYWTKPEQPKAGTVRRIKRFALFPHTYGDVTVWLEYYISVEKYETFFPQYPRSNGWYFIGIERL